MIGRCIQGDYLKVYSEGGTHGPGPPGVNEYSAWSRALCGSRADAPPALYSHGPLLVLEFHTGEKATNATGQHERIKLVFEESFLQKGDESCLNRADIIKVFDGRSAAAPVLAMLCNEIVASSCDQVFSSDKSKSGKITSPLYPAPYPQKTQCHYDFYARGRERIRLVFEDFSLQRVTASIIDCESMDSLDVFLYVDGRLEKMASFCGNDVPKPIMSNGPKMSIEFRGIYSSRHSRGFKISYYFVEDYGISTGNQLMEFPCAFVFNSSEWGRGAVTSPNYPGLYPRDTECNYFFYGNENEKVHLHFTYFDVEGVVPCAAVSASDYVQFSSQIVDTESHRHCGQLKELQVTSQRNFLRVTFRSNDRLDGTGFKADYIFLRDSVMHSITMPESDNGGAFHTSNLILLTFAFDVIREVYRHLKCSIF
ncbi:hypothetical protein MSG28_007982 [Choristoneura fumiferana]|uniref:Uncharacterized protein n=1 Tax=Choristoneura fumiferana TaxID=7141 RepID=A0ACC0J9M6_CHOFU|nr:hypothetical protein MSG28_007982 [Choristoneura fumiferana]